MVLGITRVGVGLMYYMERLNAGLWINAWIVGMGR